MNTLAALQNVFKQSGNTNSNYYPFYTMANNTQAEIRFLPDANPDNPMGFLIEKVMHKLVINGEDRTVPCMSMYGQDCPICKVSQQYYKAGDKETGKLYWKKRQHLGQALIINDPLSSDGVEEHEGKVKVISIGFQLFGIIKSAFESGDLDEIPYAYDGGYNFIIKKQQQGDYSTYALGSNFVRKPSDLTDEEKAIVEESLVDLATLLPNKPDIEKIEAMLEAALSGEPYEEGQSSNTFTIPAKVKKSAVVDEASEENEEEDDALKPKAKPKVKAKPKAKVMEEVGEYHDEEDESEDILAQIRKRRSAGN